MKYIKRYNEDIDWEFDEDETYELKEIPYVKNGIRYGYYLNRSYYNQNEIKFNLEDKIICTSSYDDNYNIIDQTGEIVDFNNQRLYLIYFFNNIQGHGDNHIPNGHAWWVMPSKLKKI